MTVHVAESTVSDGGAVPPDAAPAPRSRRPLVAGGLAAVWALLVGVALVTCLVMLAWAVSPNSTGDSAAAWRAAGLTWLGSHLVPVEVSGQPVSLLPIGGLLLGLLLTRRAGAWTGRLLPDPSTAETIGIVAGSILIYGAGGAGIAWLSAGGSAAAEPGWALLVTGVVAGVGTLWGISREARLLPGVRARVSEAAWQTASAGAAAVAGLVAVGAVLLTVSLIRHFGEVAGTLADLDAGVVGSAGLTLLGALSLPNLAIWAMAVLVGPGFEVGSIGGLSAFGGQVESLPALPVLAAIPSSVPGWTPVLMVVPVLLGVLAGRVRWGRDLPTLSGALLSGVGLAAVVATLVAGLGALSAGSFGGGQLAEVGPVLGPVTAAATGLVVLGFLLEAGFQSARLTWDLHRAEQRAAQQRGAGEQVAAAQPQGDPAGHGATLEAGAGDEGDLGEAPGPGGSPAPSGSGPWSAVTGLVVGHGAVVTSRVSGAGASAVRVVTGVGASALAGVGSAGSAATARAAAMGAAVAGAVRGGDREGAQVEVTVTAEVADPAAAVGAEPAEAGDSAGVVDVTDEPSDSAIDLRSDESAEATSGSEIDLRGVEEPSHRPDEPERAPQADPLPARRQAPATVRADDDTAEIPVIEAVRPPGPAETPPA